VLDLIAAAHQETGWLPATVCPGGGWAVAYNEDDLPIRPLQIMSISSPSFDRWLPETRAALPRLQLEPGRSLVAQQG